MTDDRADLLAALEQARHELRDERDERLEAENQRDRAAAECDAMRGIIEGDTELIAKLQAEIAALRGLREAAEAWRDAAPSPGVARTLAIVAAVDACRTRQTAPAPEPKEPRMAVLSVRVTDDEVATIRAWAAERGLSVSDVVRQALAPILAPASVVMGLPDEPHTEHAP